MNGKKEDRRVRVTKTVIRESFIELMQQQPITKISVKMICESADINRSTFYSHYADQYDLLSKIQHEVAGGIKEYISPTRFSEDNKDAISVIIRILEYAKENAPLFKVLLSEHSNSAFQEELMYLVREKTLEEMGGDAQLGASVTKYIELFATNGILSIIARWLEDDCSDTPEFLANLIMKLIMQGIRSLY